MTGLLKGLSQLSDMLPAIAGTHARGNYFGEDNM
jgi:hypothetical protein